MAFRSLNSIPTTVAQEWVSLAYTRTVCAQVGLNMSKTEHDNGIDVQIQSSIPLYNNMPEDCFLLLQLKSTTRWTVRDGKIHYSLNVKNYNFLRRRSIHDKYLVLYLMPSNRLNWFTPDGTESIMRNCAYYLDLTDYPITRNKTKKTVHVPLENKLTATVLRKLFIKEVNKFKV